MRQCYHLLSLSVLPLLVVSGCGPADPYDSLYQAQKSSAVRSGRNTFAEGYFPAAYAKPQLDCGYPVGPMPIIGEVEAEWYPRQWKAAREPSLFLLSEQEPSPEFVLRFSFLPSFDPSIFIRVQKDKSGYSLIAKKMSGYGGYDAGTISRSKEIRLTSQQSAELERFLADGSFFEQPPMICGLGLDGSRWIFELADKNGYTMVNRWSPSGGVNRNFGAFLLRLSGWDSGSY